MTTRTKEFEAGRQQGLDEAIQSTLEYGEVDNLTTQEVVEDLQALKVTPSKPDFCQHVLPHGRIGDWSRCEQVPVPGTDLCDRHGGDE